MILAGAFVFVQCGNNTGKNMEANVTEIKEKISIGTKWELVSIAIDSAEVPAPAVEANEEPVFITFQDSTQFNGFAGCNYYFGIYNMDDEGSVELIPQGSTRMSGKNQHIENAFLSSLEKVNSYTLEKGLLTFKDNTGKKLMVFGQKQ